MTNLGKLTVDELITEQQNISVARGEAEKPFKAAGRAVRDELNLRASTAKLDAALVGLDAEQRAKLLGQLQAQDANKE